MTPDQLAKSGTEHGEQRALFAWAVVAARWGFAVANDERSYQPGALSQMSPGGNPLAVPELRRMFAIPNGGFRDKITAAKLKAEGVKKGVPDIFLPVTILPAYAGLFIELKRQASDVRTAGGAKRRAGSTSNEQDDWTVVLRDAGYGVVVAVGWREAANQIQSYIEASRNA
jgi:hypothetical protein